MGDPPAFAYHRSLGPMMWVLVGISCIELLAVHLLLVALLAGWVAATILSVATVAGIGWIVALIRSMKRLPVLAGEGGLVWRVGFLRRLDVPWSAVSGLVAVPPATDLKARHVASFALIAHPNVAVALSRPVAGRRGPVTLLAHRLDDPEGFGRVLAKRLGRG